MVNTTSMRVHARRHGAHQEECIQGHVLETGPEEGGPAALRETESGWAMEAGDPRGGEEARHRQAACGETRWPCYDTTACRPTGRGEVRGNPAEGNQTNTANRHAAFDRWPDSTNSRACATFSADTDTTWR